MKIKCLCFDNGGEFISNEFISFCEKSGVKILLSAARTPQQNGVVERRNRLVQEMAQSMINESKVRDTFWREAVHTAIYI